MDGYRRVSFSRKGVEGLQRVFPDDMALTNLDKELDGVCWSPSFICRRDLVTHMAKKMLVVSGSRADFQKFLDSAPAHKRKEHFEAAKVAFLEVSGLEVWYWLQLVSQ